VISAELFTRFGKRSVDEEPFAVAYLNAGGGRCRVKRGGVQILATGMEVLCELGGLHVALLALALAQGLFIQINQQHVSHLAASILKSNSECRNRHGCKKICLSFEYALGRQCCD